MTQTILDKIKAYKLEEVAADKAAKPLADVEAEARAASPVRPFGAALRSSFKPSGPCSGCSPSGAMSGAKIDDAICAV